LRLIVGEVPVLRVVRLGYVTGKPEVSQNALDHRCLVNQRHEAPPPQCGQARTSTPNVRRINSAH
jgi:hypothetical protein